MPTRATRVLPLLLLAAACAGGEDRPAEPSACLASDSAQGIARIEEHLAAEERNGFSGSVVIGDGENVELSREYGDAARDGQPTRYRLGGLARPVLTTAVMRLVDGGYLKPTAPVAGIVPNTPAAWRDSTVHDALTSQGGDAILQGIVRAVSGMTWDAYARAQVLQPAGMTNTEFGPDGELLATAEDLHRFIGALRPGRLLNPESVAAMFAVDSTTRTPAGDYRGYGFMVRYHQGRLAEYYQLGEVPRAGHNGIVGVGRGTVFVILSNSGAEDGVNWAFRINDGVQRCLAGPARG